MNLWPLLAVLLIVSCSHAPATRHLALTPDAPLDHLFVEGWEGWANVFLKDEADWDCLGQPRACYRVCTNMADAPALAMVNGRETWIAPRGVLGWCQGELRYAEQR